MANFVQNPEDKSILNQNAQMADAFSDWIIIKIKSQEAKDFHIQERIKREWHHLQKEIKNFLLRIAKENSLLLESALGLNREEKNFSLADPSGFRNFLVDLFIARIKEPEKSNFKPLSSTEQSGLAKKINLLRLEDSKTLAQIQRASKKMIDVVKNKGFLPEVFTDQYLANDLDIDTALADKRGLDLQSKNKFVYRTISLCKESGKETETAICKDLADFIKEKKPTQGELKSGDTKTLLFPVNNGQTHFIFLKIVMHANQSIDIFMEDSKSPTPGTESAFNYAKKAAELAGYSSDKIHGNLLYKKEQMDGTSCPYYAVRKVMQEVDSKDSLAQTDINQVKLAFVKKVIQSEDSQLANKLVLENGVVIQRDMTQQQRAAFEKYQKEDVLHSASLKQIEELRKSLTSKVIPTAESLFKLPDEKKNLTQEKLEHNGTVLGVVLEEQGRITQNIQQPSARYSYAEMASEVCQMANQIDDYLNKIQNAVSDSKSLEDHKDLAKTLQESLINSNLPEIVKQSGHTVQETRKEALIHLVGTDKVDEKQVNIIVEKAMPLVPIKPEKKESFTALVRDTLLSKVSDTKLESKIKQTPEVMAQEKRDRLFAQALQDQELIDYFRCVGGNPDQRKELDRQAEVDKDLELAKKLQAEFDKEVSPSASLSRRS